uniref:Uncharacterized protein n=1 Tax=Plectus sambesii TaxID=2011161 RepID=A0A914UY31_9BILA
MLFWAVLLTAVSSLELSDGAPSQPLHAKRSPPPCDQRCRKIFDKTLQRVSYSFDAIEKLAGRLNYFDDRLSKEICWRAFDFFHCMDHCEEPEKQSFSEMRNALQSSCQERAAG